MLQFASCLEPFYVQSAKNEKHQCKLHLTNKRKSGHFPFIEKGITIAKERGTVYLSRHLSQQKSFQHRLGVTWGWHQPKYA
jgi:hypothetical protein